MVSIFEGKKIILGVTGSIAAYKAAQICSLLIKEGAIVYPVMTPNSLYFLGPATLGAISGNEVRCSQFKSQKTDHVSLAQSAAAIVVAPASANTISKLAQGICDNFLTTTVLAFNGPVIIAPAMNEKMYMEPIIQSNLDILKKTGKYSIAGPQKGRLACGEEGWGKMDSPENIVENLAQVLNFSQQLKGKKVLVTAGGTKEYIDAVRFISNASSGKMGYAMAQEAKRRGADRVMLITSADRMAPYGVEAFLVESSEDMAQKATELFEEADITIMSAAVSDIIPVKKFNYKLKKKDDILSKLSFKLNQNILQLLAQKKKPGQILVGFAAESGLDEEDVLAKFKSKKVDLIVANDISRQDIGLASDYNEVMLLSEGNRHKILKRAKKEIIARRIWDHIITKFIR